MTEPESPADILRRAAAIIRAVDADEPEPDELEAATTEAFAALFDAHAGLVDCRDDYDVIYRTKIAHLTGPADQAALTLARHLIAIEDEPDADADPATIERYCVDSGRAVSMIPGDRCLHHGARDTPCLTARRTARCTHEHRSPNHPQPHCSECGRDIPEATS
jgi:hypothetical protein